MNPNDSQEHHWEAEKVRLDPAPSLGEIIMQARKSASFAFPIQPDRTLESLKDFVIVKTEDFAEIDAEMAALKKERDRLAKIVCTAYRFVLDQTTQSENRRLSDADQFQFGRDLADAWTQYHK